MIIERLEEVISEDALKELEGDFERLDEMWRIYRSECDRVVKKWTTLRLALIDYSARLSGLVKKIEEEIEELKVKVELGLIDEEKAQHRIEYLEERKEALETELEKTKTILQKYDQWAISHKHAAKLVGDTSLVEIVAKLEELKKSGSISDETYNRIKQELKEILSMSAEEYSLSPEAKPSEDSGSQG